MQHKPRPMSDQEALNNVWQHFVVEGNERAATGPAGEPGVSCLYRTEDGKNGCAIGCQIPDKIAKHITIGNPSVQGAWEEYPSFRKYFEYCTLSFLDALQIAHDKYRVGSTKRYLSLREALEKVALIYRLEIPSV